MWEVIKLFYKRMKNSNNELSKTTKTRSINNDILQIHGLKIPFLDIFKNGAWLTAAGRFKRHKKTQLDFERRSGTVKIFLKCNFQPGFQGTLSPTLTHHHSLSLSGYSKMVHNGIVFDTPYISDKTTTWYQRSDTLTGFTLDTYEVENHWY